jgi:GR25 family glycosyltransferase involved in LPS biosynthesis
VSGLRTHLTYEVDNPGTNYRIGHKTIGIWLSHYLIWTALKLASGDHFLILESDAKFPENWRERTEQAMRDVPPDFDMFYIGSCCASSTKRTLVAGEVWDARYPLCTHAIMVAKKALETILRTQDKVYAPIDISLAFHSHPHLKVYTVLPRIVEQFDTVIPP